MSGPRFFQTMMGKHFYEGAVPRMVRALEGIHETAKLYAQLKVAPSTVAMEPQSEPLSWVDKGRPLENTSRDDLQRMAQLLGRISRLEHELYLMKGARNELEEQKKHYERVLCVIKETLWPEGDLEHEWDSDTMGTLASALHAAGFGPPLEEEPEELAGHDMDRCAAHHIPIKLCPDCGGLPEDEDIEVPKEEVDG